MLAARTGCATGGTSPSEQPRRRAAALPPWPGSRSAAESRQLTMYRAHSAAAVCESLTQAFGEAAPSAGSLAATHSGGDSHAQRKAALCAHAASAAQLSAAAAAGQKKLGMDIWWESFVAGALPHCCGLGTDARMLRSHQARQLAARWNAPEPSNNRRRHTTRPSLASAALASPHRESRLQEAV